MYDTPRQNPLKQKPQVDKKPPRVLWKQTRPESPALANRLFYTATHLIWLQTYILFKLNIAGHG